jgi:hypothetical protein
MYTGSNIEQQEAKICVCFVKYIVWSGIYCSLKAKASQSGLGELIIFKNILAIHKVRH